MEPFLLILSFLALLLFMQFGFRFILNYELLEATIKVKLFNFFTIKKIDFAEIEFIATTNNIGFKERLLSSWFNNRIIGDLLYLRKIGSFFGIMLSPDDVKLYAEKISQFQLYKKK